MVIQLTMIIFWTSKIGMYFVFPYHIVYHHCLTLKHNKKQNNIPNTLFLTSNLRTTDTCYNHEPICNT